MPPPSNFKLRTAFQITNRPFFLVGELLTGSVQVGDQVDLSSLGIVGPREVEAVEFALRENDGVRGEDFALGIKDLSEEEKELIRQQESLITRLPIINREKSDR